jgi:KaiC/GvpD/RAD55 family RecA-like ATPase
MEIISSGIVGLDKMLGGGIPKGQCILVEGAPGSGKTTLAIQFLLEGIRNGENCLFLSFQVMPKKIIDTFSRFEFYSKLKDKRLRFEHFYFEDPTFVPEEYMLITKVLDEHKPDRIVFDSITMMSAFSGDTLGSRKTLVKYLRVIEEKDATAIFVFDRVTNFKHTPNNLDFLFDGVILLSKPLIGFYTGHVIQIIKIRGLKHDIQPRYFQITEKGISIELETLLTKYFKKISYNEKVDTSA